MDHTFLFVDLAGFTALTEAHGDDRAADVAESFVLGMRELLVAHEALEVKTMGDAVMAHVGDADRALCLAACAVGDLGRRHGALSVRAGLHTGPAVHRGGDWFGSTVNIAARVAALAGPDEVLLTDATLHAAGTPPRDATIRPLGQRELRNVPRPVTLHVLQVPEAVPQGLQIDPVCRMAVAPHAAAASAEHRGRRFLFCADGCAETFAEQPRLYAARAG